MTTRPVIFISAVSKELHTARDHVAKALITLGYEPKWQDIAPTEAGDLRQVLRKWVDESSAVIQIIGHCYGYGATEPDPKFGLCSYTQYEALYAKKRGKKIWYLPISPDFLPDPHTPEPEELASRQAAYYQSIREQGDLRHSFANATELENKVLKLRDDLALLRRRSHLWAITLISFLILIASGVAILLRAQQRQERAIQSLVKDVSNISQGDDLRDSQIIYRLLLEANASEEGITANKLQALMVERASNATSDPYLPATAKVQALRDAGEFTKAREFALQEATRLETERQKASHEEIQLWLEAAKSEITVGAYDEAHRHATKAESLVERAKDFGTWASIRDTVGWTLLRKGEDAAALKLYQELVPLQKDAQGAEDRATLHSRSDLAVALKSMQRYADAEKENREVLSIQEKKFGKEDTDTLCTRSNLAVVFHKQGKYSIAEDENKSVLDIRINKLGSKHPHTLVSWNNLAIYQISQNKNAEAEKVSTELLPTIESVLGKDHPETLKCRGHLAQALSGQGKWDEAEKQYRILIPHTETVLGKIAPQTLMYRNSLAGVVDILGRHEEAETMFLEVIADKLQLPKPENRELFISYYYLAICLERQNRLPESLTAMQRAEAGWSRILGPDHLDTIYAKQGCDRLVSLINVNKPQK